MSAPNWIETLPLRTARKNQEPSFRVFIHEYPPWYIVLKSNERLPLEDSKEQVFSLSKGHFLVGNSLLIYRSVHDKAGYKRFVTERLLMPPEAGGISHPFRQFYSSSILISRLQSAIYLYLTTFKFPSIVVESETSLHEEHVMPDGGMYCTTTYVPAKTSTAVFYLFAGVTADHKHNARFINFLIQNTSWIVIGFNRRGNHCPLKTPNFHLSGWDDDVRDSVLRTKKRYPGLPIYGAGLSMGGAQLLRFCSKFSEEKMFTAVCSICSPLHSTDIKLAVSALETVMLMSLKSLFVNGYEPLYLAKEFKKGDLWGKRAYKALTDSTTTLEFADVNEQMISKHYSIPLPKVQEMQQPRTYLSKINVPALVITSEDDELVSLSNETQNVLVQNPFICWTHFQFGNHCIFSGAPDSSENHLPTFAELACYHFFKDLHSGRIEK